MKLEFLADGSPDCPLIRLYVFDKSAIVRFGDLVNSLAVGAKANASLDEQPWIEPLAGCKMELCLGQRDLGILQTGYSSFECVLSGDGWADIAGLLQPFLESDDPGVYSWLNEDGKVSLLLSSTGAW
ncbi:MAG: hypothetical protein WB421_07795 [Terriglobales bacterium]